MGCFVVPFPFKDVGPKITVLPTKKNVKKFSVGNPYTQLFDISTIKNIDLSKNITLKTMNLQDTEH